MKKHLLIFCFIFIFSGAFCQISNPIDKVENSINYFEKDIIILVEKNDYLKFDYCNVESANQFWESLFLNKKIEFKDYIYNDANFTEYNSSNFDYSKLDACKINYLKELFTIENKFINDYKEKYNLKMYSFYIINNELLQTLQNTTK